MIYYWNKISDGYALFLDKDKTQHAGAIHVGQDKLSLALWDCLLLGNCEVVETCAVNMDEALPF